MVFMFELGVMVEDGLTGFIGTITARAQYLDGDITYLVQPKVKADGEFVDGRWFNEKRLTK